MNTLQTLGSLEYKAIRYPTLLLDEKVLATRLPEDSPVRLTVERVLGRIDSAAGKLLADDQLADRGRVLTRRTEVIEKAVALEEKAAERKAEADAQLKAANEAAEDEKARIEADHQREAARLKTERAAEKAAVERKAAARKKADAKAITDKTTSIIAAERDRLDQQEAVIEAKLEAQTAAPVVQLETAVADSAAAAAKKADADRLEKLRKA